MKRNGTSRVRSCCGRVTAAAAFTVLAMHLANVACARAATLEEWSNCMGKSGSKEAVKACTAIIRSGKELPDSLPYAYLYRGRASLALRDGQSAAADFAAAIKLEPDLAHAHFGLGEIAKTREDWATAVAEFTKAAESHAEDADIDAFTDDNEGSLHAIALAELGFATYKAGDATKALGEFDAASAACPTCSAPWRSRSEALGALGRNTESLAAADKAIALNPRSPGAFVVRGLARARLHDFDAAFADFAEAIRLAPTFELSYRMRAFVYGRLGKMQEAAADAKTLELLRQGSAEALKPPPARPEVSRAMAAPALDNAALERLFRAHTWEAREGLWMVTLELRGDGSYRQRMKDTSSGGKLEVTQEGAWGISRGQICIYTNVGLCLAAHQSGDDIALVRTSGGAEEEGGDAGEGAEAGAAEFFGSAGSLHPTDADVVSSPVAEFPIDEVFLPGAKGATKGPKTLLYYMHGFDGRARAHPPLAEFFVSQLQRTQGWDVIDGAYPQKGVTEVRRFGGANVGAAVFVGRRLRELKAQGYERIFVGGQSWGGWNSLVLDGMRGLPLDGVILVVPACCGWRSVGANTSDPNFANNKFYFDHLIARARYPTVGIFFRGDEYEPADRGKSAAETLTGHGVPNLIIDHPPGYEGHGSAWFPPFDYQYEEAIATFLNTPKTAACSPASIAQAKGDFRAVVTTAQLRDWQSHTAQFGELKGRRFAVYPAGETRQIVDEVRTLVRGFGMGDSVYTSSFRDGLFCQRARVKFAQPQNTDAACVRLVWWNEHSLLGIDPQSGTVLEWWVEMR